MTGRQWFTADLHLGHENIIRYCDRPFGSVEAMNRAIVDNWNARVEDGDTVWVLGDACLGLIQESLALIEELRGHKILVPGNHDRVFLGNTKRWPEEKRRLWEGRYLAVFDEIRHSSPTGPVATAFLDGEETLLSHFPHYLRGNPRELRHLLPHVFEQDQRWLLHGHVHTEYRVLREERSINVGVDQWDFAPVSEEELLAVIGEG